jgi:hypothetical protein
VKLSLAILSRAIVLTFERRVETHASDTDRKVAQESYQKDPLMAITNAARDTLVGKKYKHQICRRVNDFGRIYGGIVVLITRVSKDTMRYTWVGQVTCLFAPIYCRCFRAPVSLAGRRVWKGGQIKGHYDIEEGTI